jgi:hypothetical protein
VLHSGCPLLTQLEGLQRQRLVLASQNEFAKRPVQVPHDSRTPHPLSIEPHAS